MILEIFERVDGLIAGEPLQYCFLHLFYSIEFFYIGYEKALTVRVNEVLIKNNRRPVRERNTYPMEDVCILIVYSALTKQYMPSES